MEKVYFPNKDQKMGLSIWKEMFREMRDSKELMWRLFVRDFSVKYRQSFLGYFWAVFLPVITIAAFIYMNRSGILNIGQTDVPYPLFALLGLAVWQVFATGLNSGVGSLVSAGGMITKINFPRETLVVAAMAQAMFDFIVKIILIVALCLFYQFNPGYAVLLFPLAVLPMLVLTLGMSLLLSMFNAVFRDTANIVMLLTSFLLFLTPVLYPVHDKQQWFFQVNPLTALINAPRDLVIYGRILDLSSFLGATALSFLFLLISWRIFHMIESKIPERV